MIDGSDVGVTGNVDAFYFESDGSILLSLSSDATLPDAGAVTDADILLSRPPSSATRPPAALPCCWTAPMWGWTCPMRTSM